MGKRLQSYIRHLEWERGVPCRDGICVTAVPIAASDGANFAGVVIGIARCGVIPFGHDGRSISVQGVGRRRGSGRHRVGLAGELVMRLYAHERLLIAQRGEADARDLVGERTGGLVVIGAGLQGEGP